ncbi:MAG: hypothetical protein Q8L55_11330 [Phycisphaerales bacterium]|nr:hypothetical protein [Phycisphaerales bacterium]
MLETDHTQARQGVDAVADVFLSPRVIDREAFNDYSGSLRRLIEEAAQQAEALKAAAAEASQAQTALRETAARHQGRSESVTRALASIDQRLADAERLAQVAEATRLGIEAASSGAQAMLTTRSDELAARLDAAAVAATETVRRAEHGSTEAVMNLVGSAERKLVQVEARLIEFKPRTSGHPVQTGGQAPDTSHLQKLLGQLAAENARAEANAAQLKALADQADRSRASLTHALAAATDQANAAAGNARDVTARTEVVVTRLARVVDSLPV